jgi:hypothetical protein
MYAAVLLTSQGQCASILPALHVFVVATGQHYPGNTHIVVDVSA